MAGYNRPHLLLDHTVALAMSMCVIIIIIIICSVNDLGVVVVTDGVK